MKFIANLDISYPQILPELDSGNRLTPDSSPLVHARDKNPVPLLFILAVYLRGAGGGRVETGGVTAHRWARPQNWRELG